jgi:hypothetical protein
VGVVTAPSEATPRRTSFTFVATPELEKLWAAGGSSRVFERTFADGKPMLTVDYHPSVGYRVWAPHHGRHIVLSGGEEILSAPPASRGWWWHRLVLAQVLPIAATLHGLELLHASAVEFGGRAFAITAAAGSGKTSLAAHLLDRGCELVTDDVLALEIVAGEILAHPGSALVNIDPRQRASIRGSVSQKLVDLPTGDSVYALAPIVDRPLALDGLYFLDRSARFVSARIVEENNARDLLGSTFISYMSEPQRLLTHLDVCARIGERVRPFRIEAPLTLPAHQIADLVRKHLEGAR